MLIEEEVPTMFDQATGKPIEFAMQKREYFQKRTDFKLGLPKNYEKLRLEVQHWPRIGNPVVKPEAKNGWSDKSSAENELAMKIKDANLDKQGFVKISDYDDVYE